VEEYRPRQAGEAIFPDGTLVFARGEGCADPDPGKLAKPSYQMVLKKAL